MSDVVQRLKATLLSLVPADGTPVGNTALRREAEALLQADGLNLSEADYWLAHADLIADGSLLKGQGRGGSVRLATTEPGDFLLAQQEVPVPEQASAKVAKPAKPKTSQPATKRATDEAPQIISYRHQDKRKNNPEVGMVTPATDPEAGKTRWQHRQHLYDPHLDPALQFDSQRGRIEAIIDDALASGDSERMRSALEELKRLQTPYLDWAGKAERTSFDVDTVSLHVHERVDPASILSAVRKAMKGEGKSTGAAKAIQPGLFDAPFENLPLRDAIDFYHHERGWANRLVAGDSLLVMNSLLQKESMAGKVQMIYFDPPYGIKYGSNFQPFVGKRDVKDRNDADLTQEPEMIKAFRDTWELGIHSYLTYLRDRLSLAKELLNETGSVFVQISDENVHLLRQLLDEVFGGENFVAQVNYRTMTPLGQRGMANVYDYVVWYAKSKDTMKFRPIFKEQSLEDEGEFRFLDNGGGTFRKVTKTEVTEASSDQRRLIFKRSDLRSSGYTPTCVFDFDVNGKRVRSEGKKSWRTNQQGVGRLTRANRLFFLGEAIYFRQYHSDFPLMNIENSWTDTAAGFADPKTYVVQTHDKIIS